MIYVNLLRGARGLRQFTLRPKIRQGLDQMIHRICVVNRTWGSDQDEVLRAMTRASLMDQCATDDITIVGYHLPNGGIGRITRANEGYRFEGI